MFDIIRGLNDLTWMPPSRSFASVGLSPNQVHLLLDAGFAAFLLHVEARIANLANEGY